MHIKEQLYARVGITKHRVGLEFEFKFEFELDFELDFQLDFELQFELILSVVTTISDTLRILQATCLTIRFISDALEHLNCPRRVLAQRAKTRGGIY